MKFLLLTQYFPPEIGAVQSRLSEVAKELILLGHEVEVVTAMPNYPTGQIARDYRRRLYLQERWQGIRIHRVWVVASLGAGMKRMVNYGSFMVMSVVGLLRCRRPDYVVIESPPLFTAIPGILFGRLWKAKVIFNVADLWPDSVRELGFLQEGTVLSILLWLEKWIYRRATYITAVTEGIKDTLIIKKGVSQGKILFLPNGVNTELFAYRARDIKILQQLHIETKHIVVYAGTMGFAQGVRVALEAMAIVEQVNSDLSLLLVGDGSDKKSLMKLALELQLQHVFFCDPMPLSSIARVYSIADAGLVCLRDIALFDGARPSKMFPIMSSGKPVIYSGSGEGARLVTTAKAGYVTPPENAQALAKTFLQVTEDPEMATTYGSNGRQYVEHHLSWAMLVRTWLDQLRVN